jgi:hypothetical protein
MKQTKWKKTQFVDLPVNAYPNAKIPGMSFPPCLPPLPSPNLFCRESVENKKDIPS